MDVVDSNKTEVELYHISAFPVDATLRLNVSVPEVVPFDTIELLVVVIVFIQVLMVILNVLPISP